MGVGGGMQLGWGVEDIFPVTNPSKDTGPNQLPTKGLTLVLSMQFSFG
jgi:hypothetical protein